MPEGHLIHHYSRAHAAELRGPIRVSSPQGRFAHASRLDGEEIQTVEAYGKHLFYWWTSETLLHVHLGLQGVFVHHDPPAPEPRPQVRLRLASRDRVVDLIAPRQCDLIARRERGRIVGRLGGDPLREDVDAADVRRRLRASGAPIGAVLLDQSVIAGLGNVLRAEILNMMGIHPSTPARSLDDTQVERLWDVIVLVMEQAARQGRIITAAPATRTDGTPLPEREGRFVYRQEACRRCGTPVEHYPMGGRTAYVCPTCQPRP